MSRAMAAGVSATLWTMEDIAERIEARRPKAAFGNRGPRKPYKHRAKAYVSPPMRPYAALLLLCLSACATPAPGTPPLPADKALVYCEASLGPAPPGGRADYLTQCMQDQGYMPSDRCLQAMDRVARERLLRDPGCFMVGHTSVGPTPVS